MTLKVAVILEFFFIHLPNKRELKQGLAIWRKKTRKETFPLVSVKPSLVAQSVKNSPAVQETQVRSLDWEEELVKETATHSSILHWRIPWTAESDGLQSVVPQELNTK